MSIKLYRLFEVIYTRMKCRKDELLRLQHLLTHSLPEERIIFKLNVISYLTQSTQQQLKQFAQNPSKFLKSLYDSLNQQAKMIINDQQITNLIKYYNLSIQLTSIPYLSKIYRKLGSISSEDVGKWVIISGTVVQCTQTKTLQKSKLFACNECGAQYRKQNHYQTHYRFDLPSACTNLVQKQKSNNIFNMFYKNMSKRKGKEETKVQGENDKKRLAKCGSTKFSPVQEKKICVDYFELRLQEQFKHITAGRLPQSVVVTVQGAVESACRPGDDIVVNGMLDYRFKKPNADQTFQLQLIIIANTINLQKSSLFKDQDRQTIFQQTQESISNLTFEHFQNSNRIAYEIELRNAAISKFCPGIFGRQPVKLGILLSLLGGVSIQNEQTKIRGQSHMLLIGEPGTGKSVLLKQAANLAERSFFTNGIGTSSAGLSVSYVKDGGDWTIQPGALVLADNGICCIDELNLLSKKDQNSLLEAMQQQTVSSAKASVVGRLNARTTLICACNPITVTQKYDPSLDLQVNTGLSIPLLTRFDIIMILKDEGGISQDITRCEHILQKFLGGQIHHQPHHHNFSLKQLLRKCRLYSPQLRCGELLSKYYIQQRKNNEKVTTARAFQSLCRLAEAHAKLMMRDYTNGFDCLTAIMLTEGVFVSTEEDYITFAQRFCSKYHIDLQECLTV